MANFLGNAFSLPMVSAPAEIAVEPVTASDVAAASWQSVIGHADTAAVVSGLLGRPAAFNRTNVRLQKGDVLYVAQVTGGRLPEGATTLPEGVKIVFLKVTVK